ncbi:MULTISPECIES: MFS transporter [unclassified Nonomuraea]|uniref:MFS transporter n=1 Tax=unclassified Nonomuraea TaxID=2593643 RepID=UPI0033F2D056
MHPSATQILWIADAYGFALAALLVTMGGIGDRIGHKKLLLIGTVGFAAASALTASAPNAEMLIAARALLGVAGATLMPSALSLIRQVFTEPKERTSAIGIFSAIGGLAVGLGPVLGGALLTHFSWRAVFLINVPIMAVAFVAGLVLLPEARGLRPGRLDLLSVPLSAVGVLGIVYGVKEAAQYGLAETHVVIPVIVGVAGLVLFPMRQARVTEPLLDVSLFRRAAFTGSITTNLFAMFALVAQSLIFSQYFQLVLGWTPLTSGLAGLPAALGSMVGGGVLAPVLINALGRARAVATGLIGAAAAYSLFLLAGVEPNYPLLLIPMILSGTAMGLALTITGDTVLAAVPKERTGAASAISETATELGGALGMAVLGSILNAVYRNTLQPPTGLDVGARRAAGDSLGAAMQVAGQLPGRLAGQLTAAAKGAFVNGMHLALLGSAAFAALVAVAALVTLRHVPKVIPADDDRELATASH